MNNRRNEQENGKRRIEVSDNTTVRPDGRCSVDGCCRRATLSGKCSVHLDEEQGVIEENESD